MGLEHLAAQRPQGLLSGSGERLLRSTECKWSGQEQQGREAGRETQMTGRGDGGFCWNKSGDLKYILEDILELKR